MSVRLPVRLQAGHNRLASLPPSLFSACMATLRRVSLEANELTSLHRLLFSNATALHELSLPFNSITALHVKRAVA